MIYENKPRYQRPETIDELVDLLLSDLQSEHREILAAMSEEEFEQFYFAVAFSVLEEFGLWTGNEKLLASVMADGDDDQTEPEPARIVLKKMRDRLMHSTGVLIVT